MSSKKNPSKRNVPEIVKILWYRHKVDNWSIKKISEVYNISKSTIYRWFKNIKDEFIDEDYIRFEIDSMSNEFSNDYIIWGGEVLSREYLKSSFESVPVKQDQIVSYVELPERYEMNYAYALPLDPFRIFIYWEINQLDKGNILIKIFDDTSNEKLLHMVLSSGYFVGNMYVPVGIPDRIYFAELYLDSGNNLLFKVRTNKVRTPRNSPSNLEIMNMYDWYNIDQTMFSISSFIINRF